MKRNFFVVANPVSGIRRLERMLRELVDFYASKKYDFDIFLTSKVHNAQKTIANNFTEKYTDLVIVGGDGTINEAINGLTYDVPVSIIPAGSGNDFTKMLPLGHTLEDYIQTMDHGKIIAIDLGICNGRKFANGVGIGFDGQIVQDMQHRHTLLRGATKYYAFVLRILASYRPRQFSGWLDERKLEGSHILLCVGNGSTFGGSFKLTPRAHLQDGLLDVCEIGEVSPLRRFLNIHRLQKGTHDTLPEVQFHQCQHVHVSANPRLFAHIDGEPFGSPPFDIRVLPGALRVRIKA